MRDQLYSKWEKTGSSVATASLPKDVEQRGAVSRSSGSKHADDRFEDHVYDRLMCEAKNNGDSTIAESKPEIVGNNLPVPAVSNEMALYEGFPFEVRPIDPSSGLTAGGSSSSSTSKMLRQYVVHFSTNPEL